MKFSIIKVLIILVVHSYINVVYSLENVSTIVKENNKIYTSPKKSGDKIYNNGGDGAGTSIIGDEFDSDYCSSAFIINDNEYDLSSIQNSIFKISLNKTYEFYVNLCMKNITGYKCDSSESICMVDNENNSDEVLHLGYFDTLKYTDNGVLGLDFSFVGDQCYYYDSYGSNSGGSGVISTTNYYKTNISLICGSVENQRMAKFLNPCQLSIIIKTTESCIVASQSINSILKIFVILFAVIIAFGFIIGLIILCKEKIKNLCCCCIGSGRNRNDYIQIDNHDNININGVGVAVNNQDQPPLPQQNANNQLNNNNINNNSNNNNNNNNNGSNNNGNIYNHTILQGQTPESDICVICFEGKINCVLLECGHLATCLNCTKKINCCPICRNPIKSIVQMYQV